VAHRIPSRRVADSDAGRVEMRPATAARRYDAVLIGTGIIGVSIAFELAKRGYATLSIDLLPAAGYGPTSNSCAIVRSHYSSREGVAMAFESYFYWNDWERHVGNADEAGLARFEASGMIVVKSATGQYKKSLRHYRDLGVAFEEWDAAELKRRCPIYDVRSFYPPRRPDDPAFNDQPTELLDGAVFTPQAGYVLDPQRATENVKRAAEAVGGEFLFNRKVVGIRQRNGRVAGVTLADGTEIDAPIVVNVAGPHSAVVNRMAGVTEDMRVKTHPLRHEVHHVPAPADFDFGRDGIATSDGDLGIYFRPEGENHILVGSEDPACDEREWIEDPDHWNRGVTERQWEAQVYRLARRIPTLPIPNERKGVVDLYDVSDDWIPIYDHSSLRGFYMAIGSSGNQFKTAPVAGHLMAELIDRVEHGHDHDHDPVAVSCRYTGLELDAGFYSRRREVIATSSFSVIG
jgi:sarcosine oxidase subunit beta